MSTPTYSICIKRTSPFVFEQHVRATFDQLFELEGAVERVDIIERIDNRTSQPFHIVFVHFSDKLNRQHGSADNFFSAIDSKGEARVIYNEPWFFKCYKITTNPAPAPPRMMTEADETAWKQRNANKPEY